MGIIDLIIPVVDGSSPCLSHRRVNAEDATSTVVIHVVSRRVPQNELAMI